MKKTIILLATLLSTWAHSQNKNTAAVVGIDSKGIVNTPEEVTFLTRLELEKSGKFAVLDRYEVAETAKTHSIDPSSCFSKNCLVEFGRLLNVTKVISGNVERFGEKIVITLRLIDVASASIEKTEATEYLNLPEIQKMIGISVRRLIGMEADPNMVKLLIDYDVPIESPKNTLRLNGPRMGFSATLGKAHDVLTGDNKQRGEFGMFPANFQFGWQQEIQYISAGNFQALIENLIMIGGVESGRFIPSFSPLMGFRFGKGWEFGFGPNFRLVRKAEGFYDRDNLLKRGAGEWYLENEWRGDSAHKTNPYTIESRIDSRGAIGISTGLVIAVGKTFRSGYLNIPVNLYFAPRKDGSTVGILCGFNIQKKSKVE
jgi:hypothetical protein